MAVRIRSERVSRRTRRGGMVAGVYWYRLEFVVVVEKVTYFTMVCVVGCRGKKRPISRDTCSDAN